MEADDAIGAVVSRAVGIEAEAVGIHGLMERVAGQTVCVGTATIVGIDIPMAIASPFSPMAFGGRLDGLIA